MDVRFNSDTGDVRGEVGLAGGLTEDDVRQVVVDPPGCCAANLCDLGEPDAKCTCCSDFDVIMT